MQSADDYDFDDPHHQADLDGIIERLLARRRADRSRLTDPLSRMMDILSDPFKRTEEPTTQVEKPRPKELPAAHTLDEMRANLGARRGTRGGRKAQPMRYEPTLDLKLIEEMYNRGDNLDKIRAHLRVGMARLHLEVSVFLPHLINERRGRRPKALDPAVVVAMRAEGKSLETISCELKVSKQRLVEVLEKHAPHLANRQTIDPLKVKQLRARGFTQARIAEELGCSAQAIYKHLRRIREREKRDVERLRAEGWSWKRIGEELNACRKRLARQYGQPSTDSTTSTTTPTALK